MQKLKRVTATNRKRNVLPPKLVRPVRPAAPGERGGVSPPITRQRTRSTHRARLPIAPPYPPMEALSVDEIPSGDGWLYEPKWDGFRALAFRDGRSVQLQSKSGQPLSRYFPELIEAIQSLPADRFVLDGEIVVPVGSRLSFDDLLLRIHPAEGRIRKLAAQRPAMLIVFDLLVDTRGQLLVDRPLTQRRVKLNQFARSVLNAHNRIRVSLASADRKQALRWLRGAGTSVDGVIAKRLDLPYAAGERSAMQKIKRIESADCVVGGFRYGSNERIVGSLLLGLYDDQGLLHHVGFTSSLPRAARAALTPKLQALIKPPGFTGRAPGGPSRWSTGRSTQWEPLKLKLVVEVTYDHFTGGRFRHGTSFLRWRPDKAPRQCTLDQIARRGQGYEALLTDPSND